MNDRPADCWISYCKSASPGWPMASVNRRTDLVEEGSSSHRHPAWNTAARMLEDAQAAGRDAHLKNVFLPVQIKQPRLTCRGGGTSTSFHCSNGDMPLVPSWAKNASALGRALASEDFAAPSTPQSVKLVNLLRLHWLEFTANRELPKEPAPALDVNRASYPEALAEQERDAKRSFLVQYLKAWRTGLPDPSAGQVIRVDDRYDVDLVMISSDMGQFPFDGQHGSLASKLFLSSRKREKVFERLIGSLDLELIAAGRWDELDAVEIAEMFRRELCANVELRRRHRHASPAHRPTTVRDAVLGYDIRTGCPPPPAASMARAGASDPAVQSGGFNGFTFRRPQFACAGPSARNDRRSASLLRAGARPRFHVPRAFAHWREHVARPDRRDPRPSLRVRGATGCDQHPNGVK